MLSRIKEIFLGRDALERSADRGLDSLRAELQWRRLVVPREPTRFIDAADFTAEELLEVLAAEARELEEEPFIPWVTEDEGQRELAVFSSQARLVTFNGQIAQQLKRVFPLGSAEIFLADLIEELKIDVIHLNPLNRRSWRFEVDTLRAASDPRARWAATDIDARDNETTLAANRQTCTLRTLVAMVLFAAAVVWQIHRRGGDLLSIRSAIPCGVIALGSLSVWVAQWSNGVCWPWLRVLGTVMCATTAIGLVVICMNWLARHF